MKRFLALLLLLSSLISVTAQTFSCVYRDSSEGESVEYNNAEIGFGYTNWGTDDDPEIVWGMWICDNTTNDIVKNLWFSERSVWTFQNSEKYLKNSDIALVKDCYYLRPLADGSDIIRIGTYGSNVNGTFTPHYMIVSIYRDDGKPYANVWIEYTAEVKREIYDSIKNAIKNIGIQWIE